MIPIISQFYRVQFTCICIKEDYHHTLIYLLKNANKIVKAILYLIKYSHQKRKFIIKMCLFWT